VEKNSVLYKSMSRYRIKFLVINIILTLLFVFYTANKLPYLKTAWFGESPLDVQRFLEETSTITVDELVELTRKDRRNPDACYLKQTSYWQDDAYRFIINADSIEETDIVFKGKMTTASSEVVYQDMYRLCFAEIGGRKVAVLAFANQEFEKNMTACIVHMQKPVLSGISQIASKEGPMEICEYVIDVRGLEMEAEFSDHSFFWIYLAGLIFLYIKLIRYFINPINTPTYRQLIRYGKIETVADEISRQANLPSARRNGKDLVLDEFILTKGFLKLCVTKNHMAKN